MFLYTRLISKSRDSKTPVVKDDGRVFVTCREAVAQRWQRFFASKLGGIVRDAHDILVDIHASCRSSFIALARAGIDNTIVPSWYDVLHMMSYGSSDRAWGEDSLPADVYKASPSEIADLFFPLYFKCIVRA